MQKNLYFELQDGEYIEVMSLDMCFDYIKSRINELPPSYMEEQKYTLTPKYLTEEEFKNLPEA